MARPAAVTLGQWIRYDEDEWQIVELAGICVRLRSPRGAARAVLLSDLLTYGEFQNAERPDPAITGPSDGAAGDSDTEQETPAPVAGTSEDYEALLKSLPREELERVLDLETHILEILTGFRGGEPSDDSPPDPRYDLSLDVRERVKNKHVDLHGTRHQVSERQLWRQYGQYRDVGAWGLVDGRKARTPSALKKLDPRVRDAIVQQSRIEDYDSGAGIRRFVNRVEQRLAALYGPEAPPLPAESTLRRRIHELLGKSHPSTSAARRQAMANEPAGTHGHFTAFRPGEVVMLDSTRFDVLAYDPLTDSEYAVELTLAIDLYTRSILAWRFTPLGANAVDAALLLADSLTPETMRPGWSESLRYAYYSGHLERAVTLEDRLAAIAARPVIWPETLVVDNGKIYVSNTMKRGCVRLGVNLQYARLRKPTDKPEVERVFGTIRTQFAEHLAGYKGRSVSERGTDVEDSARWSLDQIEEFFAEYVVAVYQRRPHDGLHALGAPHLELSPNDMYAEGIAVAGAIPVPPSDGLYCELLPIEWRVIHSFGVIIDDLVYDGPALQGLRRTKSIYGGQGGKWPIRKDPRNRLHVYFQHPDTNEWHELRWTRAEDWFAPFTDRTIAYVKRILLSRGIKHPNADDVAAALRELQLRMDAPEAATATDRRRLTRDRARAKSTLRDQARANVQRDHDGEDDDAYVITTIPERATPGLDAQAAPGPAAESPESRTHRRGLDMTKLKAFGTYGATAPAPPQAAGSNEAPDQDSDRNPDQDAGQTYEAEDEDESPFDTPTAS